VKGRLLGKVEVQVEWTGSNYWQVCFELVVKGKMDVMKNFRNERKLVFFLLASFSCFGG
jgi:hypothetical protein